MLSSYRFSLPSNCPASSSPSPTADAAGPPGETVTTIPYAPLADASDDALRRLPLILFTVTVHLPGDTEVERVYSTHPEIYPVGGRKKLDPSQSSPIWNEQVVVGQRGYVGSDRAAVREFFFDWATIESLGCDSIINTPVVVEGKTIGTINFLGAQYALTEADLPVALEITEAATSAIERAWRQAG